MSQTSQTLKHRFRMHRAGLRVRLTLTYAISIVMAVLLTYASYHLTRFPEDGLRMRLSELGSIADSGFLGRILVAATVVSLVLGYIIARSLTRRIDDLVGGARRRGAGTRGQRAQRHPPVHCGPADRGGPATRQHGVRRTVPPLDEQAARERHAGGRLATSDVANGA